MEKLRVIGARDSDLIQEFHIENRLEAMQDFVGGYIEQLTLPNGYLLICNEEGKLENLPPRLNLRFDVIVGNWFICAPGDEGEYRGLTTLEFLNITVWIRHLDNEAVFSLPQDVQDSVLSLKPEEDRS